MEQERIINRSELWHKIHSYVAQIPREDCREDAVDASSCAVSIEEMLNSYFNLNESYCSNEIRELLNEKGFKLAPTNGLVIEWLRTQCEGDNTDIWVTPFLSPNPKRYTPTIWQRGEIMVLPTEESATKATEAAILYTLKNLIR